MPILKYWRKLEKPAERVLFVHSLPSGDIAKRVF